MVSVIASNVRKGNIIDKDGKLGERVRIHLINLGQMAHPMHSHGFATRIVATDGHPVEGTPLLKDTVNIAPGASREPAA